MKTENHNWIREIFFSFDEKGYLFLMNTPQLAAGMSI